MHHWQTLFLTVALLWSGIAQANNACVQTCEIQYTSCAEVSAAGCSVLSGAASAGVKQLAGKISGFGGAVAGYAGTAAKMASQAACEEKLAPCNAVQETCLAKCGMTVGEGGQITALTAAGPVATSSIRIFSNQPRALVYLNGERMGATPTDPLQPFVTPDIPVGKYWIRMVTQDGALQWEGHKDCNVGPVNSVEGVLASASDAAWDRADGLDAAGDKVGAFKAYTAFLDRFGGDPRAADARGRVEALTASLQAFSDELISAATEAESMADIATMLALHDNLPEQFHSARAAELRASLADKQAAHAAYDALIASFNTLPEYPGSADLTPLSEATAAFLADPGNVAFRDEVVPLADELGIWFDPAAYPGSELYKQELKRGSYRYNNGGLGLALGALLVPIGGLVFAIPELSPDIDHAPVTIGVGSTILGLGAIGLIAGSGVRARTKREIDERYGRSEGSAPSVGTSRR